MKIIILISVLISFNAYSSNTRCLKDWKPMTFEELANDVSIDPHAVTYLMRISSKRILRKLDFWSDPLGMRGVVEYTKYSGNNPILKGKFVDSKMNNVIYIDCKKGIVTDTYLSTNFSTFLKFINPDQIKH